MPLLILYEALCLEFIRMYYKLIMTTGAAGLMLMFAASHASAQAVYNVQTGLPTNLTLPITMASVVTTTPRTTTVTRAAAPAASTNANLGNFGQLILLNSLFNNSGGVYGLGGTGFGNQADLGRLYVYSQLFNNGTGGIFGSSNQNNTINRLYLWNSLFNGYGNGLGTNSNTGRLFYLNELFRTGKSLNQNDLGQLFILSDLFNNSGNIVPVPVPYNTNQGIQQNTPGYSCPSGACQMMPTQQIPSTISPPSGNTGTSSQGGF